MGFVIVPDVGLKMEGKKYKTFLFSPLMERKVGEKKCMT